MVYAQRENGLQEVRVGHQPVLFLGPAFKVTSPLFEIQSQYTEDTCMQKQAFKQILCQISVI